MAERLIKSKIKSKIKAPTAEATEEIMAKLEQEYEKGEFENWEQFLELAVPADFARLVAAVGEEHLSFTDLKAVHEEFWARRLRGGRKSRKRRTKRRTIGGKKSRKQRKRTTLKGGKRKRRRTRRRR